MRANMIIAEVQEATIFGPVLMMLYVCVNHDCIARNGSNLIDVDTRYIP